MVYLARVGDSMLIFSTSHNTYTHIHFFQNKDRSAHPLPSGNFEWPSSRAGEAIVLAESLGASVNDLTTFFAGITGAS